MSSTPKPSLRDKTTAILLKHGVPPEIARAILDTEYYAGYEKAAEDISNAANRYRVNAKVAKEASVRNTDPAACKELVC